MGRITQEHGSSDGAGTQKLETDAKELCNLWPSVSQRSMYCTSRWKHEKPLRNVVRTAGWFSQQSCRPMKAHPRISPCKHKHIISSHSSRCLLRHELLGGLLIHCILCRVGPNAIKSTNQKTPTMALTDSPRAALWPMPKLQNPCTTLYSLTHKLYGCTLRRDTAMSGKDAANTSRACSQLL